MLISQTLLEESYELQKHWAATAKKHGVDPGPYSISEDGLIVYSPENEGNAESRDSVTIPTKKRTPVSSGSNK